MEKITSFFKHNGISILMITIVVVISVILATFIITKDIARLKLIAEERLQLQTNLIINNAGERYNGGIVLLNSLRGFFAGSNDVTRDEFYSFINASHFFEDYSGFSTIAYIERIPSNNKQAFLHNVRSDTTVKSGGYPLFDIAPTGARNEYWPIVYVSPEDKAYFLLGQDQHTDTVRSENIARARDSGRESLSTAVQLKQGGVGAIIAAPLYETKQVPASLEDRQIFFSGAITAAFLLDDFFMKILPFDSLKQQSISVAITGRGENTVQLFTPPTQQNNFIYNSWGIIEKTGTLDIEPNTVQFIFTAPVSGLLSAEEVYEPIFLASIFLFGAIFFSIIIVISQKMKLIAELKNKYEFIVTLSHQLRTPITNLRWHLEGRKVPDEEKEVQGIIVKNILSLNSIVDRMMLDIEISDEAVYFKKKKISIEELYKKVIKELSYLQDITRIKRVGKSFDDTYILFDEKRGVMALFFIIENALIYSPKNSPVTVEFQRNEKTIDIIISDKGYGVPEDEQKKIFSEFFRATNASLGINHGSGVSLYLVKKILEAHGGKINFISKENSGSTFTIELKIV